MIYLRPTAILLALLCTISCGSDDSRNSISAPESLSGITYRMTITSGTGILAGVGQYVVTFANTGSEYTTTGDGINVADSVGSYVYTYDSTEGIASFVDSVASNGNFVFNYQTRTGGSYQMTIQSDPQSNQSGTFKKI